MRIKSNLSSAGEQMRSADDRRSGQPEAGKSKWLASALGGAVALGATALCGAAYAAPITPPGETAGINTATPLPEGVYFVNIFGTGGDYLVDDKRSNLTFDVPALAWSTPWQINFFGLTGRFEVIAAPPVVANVGIAQLPGTTCHSFSCRDFTAMYNPFAEAGFAWDLGGGWAFSSFDGGYGPIDNELRIFGHDIWVYNNRSAIAWVGDLFPGGMKDGGGAIKGTFALENVLGLTGNDLQTGARVQPDYDNVNLTAYVTIGKWDLGLIAFYTTDTENFAYGPAQCGGVNTVVGSRTIVRSCEQARAAIGPLIEYDFPGISMQVNYSFDVYDENYRNLNGSRMEIQQFWLKTIIPLWTAPKLEESMK